MIIKIFYTYKENRKVINIVNWIIVFVILFIYLLN